MDVIGFCGLPGAGKSTAIESIKDLGEVVTMGDVIRKEAKKRNLAPTDKILGKIGKELREEFGSDIIAKKCVLYIENLKSDVIFVDGVRSVEECKVFRKRWEFPLILIRMDDSKRYKNLSQRGRKDDPESLEDLRVRDQREIEYGLSELVKIVDYTILNDSTIEELKKNTREFVLKLIE
ncbi:MAG: AAA family ATPase [Candidatus Lokiarchaeota archaeon]|nr:AAA family ATPase [Candidatus Lokiarchaeota archaeon]MBD3342505.1 AAA family ATPase [Candidatus Lokiarchaeota archaeon]